MACPFLIFLLCPCDKVPVFQCLVLGRAARGLHTTVIIFADHWVVLVCNNNVFLISANSLKGLRPHPTTTPLVPDSLANQELIHSEDFLDLVT